MKFSILLIFIALSLGQMAYAENCSTIELDSPGQSLAHVSQQDQGDTPFCFAYATAQMIDAYRFSHGDRDFSFATSPVTLATEMSDTLVYDPALDYRNPKFAGRSVSDAVDQVIGDQRVCRSQNYDSAAQLSVLETLENSSDPENPLAQINHKFQNSCVDANFKVVNIPTAQNVNLENQLVEQKLEAINLILDLKDAQPVAFVHCRNIYQRAGLLVDTEQSCVRHVALITGRRADPRTGKCQLKIRNSWGLNCGGERAFECNQGNMWADADIILEKTSYLTYLQ